MAHVVIIEDSPLVIQMLTMVLEGAGHQVTPFERFGQATDALSTNPPDVVITDLNLPDAPRGDVVGQLRALQGMEPVPIIVISGRPRRELEELAAEAGAQGALSKDEGMPAISSQLPSMIDELL